MERSDFRMPSKTYRPAPFWSWNGLMQPDEIKRQIRLMHEQGFGGFFMHSRVGLETPYMGEEWMQAIATGIESARELDMEAWFYDEDKWPSGFAGGAVPALGDDYRIKGLETLILDAAGVAEVWTHPRSGVKPGYLRVMFRLELENEQLRSFKRLAEPPPVRANGTYMLCQMCTALSGQERYNGESYVDLMDPKVTAAFIQYTHEAYKKRFGHFFGPNAPGIFTDEPNVQPITGGIQTSWTPALPTRFQELHGYDLVEKLPLLFLQGEGCKQVRHDYWATITILFRDNFTRPFSAWCEQNGLIMTGHHLGEDNPIGQVMRSGAVMPHYPYAHLPGIDHLGRNIKNPQTLKQVSSVAHQMERKRVLCEIFGTAGHSMSFADQKWIADFHFALGITYLNQHLTLYSMLGERKRDFPTTISWAQPYWPDYRTFNDYAARCSWFTQRGDFRADILLLHPIGTLWSLLPGRSEEPYYPSYTTQVAEAQAMGQQFLQVFTALLTDHRDFDLGDELVMAEYASVEGDELRVGSMRYKTVVLPYCAMLNATTIALLQTFVAAGGSVYLVGDHSLATSLAGVQLVTDAQLLVSLLDSQLPRLVSITHSSGEQANNFLYHQRTEGDRQLYFLANTDLDASTIVQVEVVAQGDVTVFDPTSGNIAVVDVGERAPFTWAAVEVKDKTAHRIVLQWHAAPAGSLMFSVGSGPDTAVTETNTASDFSEAITCAEASISTEPVHRVDGPWSFTRLHPNVLTLDYCRASIAGEPMSDEFRPTATVRDQVLKACGRDVQIQPYRYLTGQIPERPVPVELEFGFFVEALPAKLALVLEKPDKVVVRVNKQVVTQRAVDETGTDLGAAWIGDQGLGAFDILPLVQKGANCINLSFTAAADGADVEEVYLLGDFGVWNRNGWFFIGQEPETLLPGSWVDQGYPFYTGTMRYHLVVNGAFRWLNLGDAAASLLRVSVEGGDTILLPWRPWEVDLGDNIKCNATVDVDVVSSLRNAFGPLHHTSGDLMRVSPQDFKVNPKFWTDAYQFAAYGLMGPVRLK